MIPRLTALGLLVAAAALFYAFGGGDYLSIAGAKAHFGRLSELYAERPVAVVAGFIVLQAGALALCLPGAVLAMSLIGGALFGPWLGAGIVLTAITIGDSLGFLIARYILRDLLARRFRKQIDKVAEGEGAIYLLGLRMMAVVPYFVVNIAMAMTPMRLRLFAPVSFLGLVPATLLYTHAGSALGRIDRAAQIYTPTVLASFAALAVLPFAARWAYRRFQEARS